METPGKRRWCYLISRLGTWLDCSLSGAFCTCCTCTSDGKRWQTALMLSHLYAWNLIGLFFVQCLLYLLHMHIWWKALANSADVISSVRLELDWIVLCPVPSVPVAHAHLMESAGKRRWCYLISRLGTWLDCSLSSAFCTCCTCTSDGKRWQIVLMLSDLGLGTDLYWSLTSVLCTWCTCPADGNRC